MRFLPGSNVGLNLAQALFSGSSQRSVIARIRFGGTINANGNGIFSIDPRATGTNGNRWTLRLAADRFLRVEIQGSGFTSSLAVPVNEWSIVSLSLGAGGTLANHTIGLDGTYEAATGTNAVNTNPAYSTWIGTFAESDVLDRELGGDIDWLAAYDRAVSTSEIDSLSHDPFAGLRTRQRSYFSAALAEPPIPTFKPYFARRQAQGIGVS
jgi:hypothetical protein